MEDIFDTLKRALHVVGRAHVRPDDFEVALAAVTRDDAGVADESADLLYHLIVLLQARGMAIDDVIGVLKRRHAAAD